MSMFSETDSFLEEQVRDYDPSVANGFDIKFNKEIIYKCSGKEKIYRTRILTSVGEDSVLNEVRFELFDDENIDFLYECSLTQEEYEEFKSSNQLTIPFDNFANSVQVLLENSVKKADEFECRFAENAEDETASIKFYQKLRLRKVDIFGLDFHRSVKEFIEAQAQSRFNRLKNELSHKRREYNEIIKKIQSKNPTIAKRLIKSVENAVNTPK